MLNWRTHAQSQLHDTGSLVERHVFDAQGANAITDETSHAPLEQVPVPADPLQLTISGPVSTLKHSLSLHVPAGSGVGSVEGAGTWGNDGSIVGASLGSGAHSHRGKPLDGQKSAGDGVDVHGATHSYTSSTS